MRDSSLWLEHNIFSITCFYDIFYNYLVLGNEYRDEQSRALV